MFSVQFKNDWRLSGTGCPCVGSCKQNNSESAAHSQDQQNIKRYYVCIPHKFSVLLEHNFNLSCQKYTFNSDIGYARYYCKVNSCYSSSMYLHSKCQGFGQI